MPSAKIRVKEYNTFFVFKFFRSQEALAIEVEIFPQTQGRFEQH
jgi:hypothetical protein